MENLLSTTNWPLSDAYSNYNASSSSMMPDAASIESLLELQQEVIAMRKESRRRQEELLNQCAPCVNCNWKMRQRGDNTIVLCMSQWALLLAQMPTAVDKTVSMLDTFSGLRVETVICKRPENVSEYISRMNADLEYFGLDPMPSPIQVGEETDD